MNAVFKTFLALIRLPGYPGISLAMFLSGIASSFAVPYTSLFGATEAHMTPVRLGIFMTLTAVSSVIVSTYLGRIADRRSDKKRIVLLSIAGSALGYALLCVTRNYILLTIFGCVFLSIGAAVFPQLFTFGKARLHAEGIEHTEMPMATLRTTLSCAWVFGPAVGAIVLGVSGFNGLFLSAAGAFAIAGFIVLCMREPKAYDTLEAADKTSSEIPPQDKNAHVYAALVSFTLIGMGSDRDNHAAGADCRSVARHDRARRADGRSRRVRRDSDDALPRRRVPAHQQGEHDCVCVAVAYRLFRGHRVRAQPVGARAATDP